MTRALAVAVAAVMVVLAGVAAVGASEPRRPDAQTASTGPSQSVPTTLQEPRNGTTIFPPGAAEEGIENATRLIEAHQAALQNTSYSEQSHWEGVGRNTTANGTFRGFEVGQQTGFVEKGVNGTELFIGSSNESNAYWFTDTATVTRTHSRSHGVNDTIYRYSRTQDEALVNARYLVNFSSLLVEPYLRDLEYEHVETTTRDNRTLHTYASTGINETVEPNIGDTPVRETTETITATAVVSDRGIIHSFSAQETHSFQNETVTTVQNVSVEAIGETNATPPVWVSEEIAQFDATLVENGSVVALTHTGGKTVEDPGLLFYTLNVSTQTTVNGTLEAAETVYGI